MSPDSSNACAKLGELVTDQPRNADAGGASAAKRAGMALAATVAAVTAAIFVGFWIYSLVRGRQLDEAKRRYFESHTDQES